MRLAILVVFLLVLLGVTPLAASAEKEALDFPIVMTIVVVGDPSGGKAPEDIEVAPGDYFKVVLYAAGGTGYSWVLESQSPGTVEIAADHTVPVSSQLNGPPLAGGMVKWEFYLHVKAEATGQETLHFTLSRPWEKNQKPARMFDLHVITRPSDGKRR
jgi:Predicted secreted protein